jgi:hypothetical protein
VYAVVQIEPGEQPNQQYVTIQYTVTDKNSPDIDDKGNKQRKVQIEQGMFLQGEDGVWRFADYKLVVVPENMAKISEQEVKDKFNEMDAARAEAEGGAAAVGGEADQQTAAA